ncbi:MAG: hypothetical protein K6E58_01995 [Eubacterium sp.]|nr:hypothetical protein [Eubacterium sp.]
MFNYIWPIGMIVIANIIYNITTKETPQGANAFLSLSVTYGVAMIATFVIFLFNHKGDTIRASFGKLNWTSFVLGIAIIGLELGYIFAFRNGWQVNMTSIVANIILAISLVVVGFLLYHEKLSITQVIGIVLCLGGLVLVCKK